MKRPTSVTVFGILNIFFAIFGVIGIFASLALLKLVGDQHNPVVQLLHQNSAYAAWFKLMIPIGLLSALVLGAAGIGLLLLKNWARLTAIGYGIYAIVFGLINTAINFVFMVVPLLNHSSSGSTVEFAGQIGAAVGSIIGGLIGLVYPILLLVFMTRPKIVAAFHSIEQPTIAPQY